MKNYKHPIVKAPRIQPNGDLTETIFSPNFFHQGWPKKILSRRYWLN